MVKFNPTVKRGFVYGTANSTSASEFGVNLLTRATLFQEPINQLVKTGCRRRPNGDGKRLTGEQKRVRKDASGRPHHTDTRIRRFCFCPPLFEGSLGLWCGSPSGVGSHWKWEHEKGEKAGWGEKLTDWKRNVGGRGVTAGVLYADAIFALMPRVPVWLETEGTRRLTAAGMLRVLFWSIRRLESKPGATRRLAKRHIWHVCAAPPTIQRRQSDVKNKEI